MKALIFLLAILPSLALSQSFIEPVLSAQAITEITNKYLVSEKKIKLEKYTLENVSFNYLQSRGKENYWSVSFWGKPNEDGSVGLGNHFSIRLNNSEKPEIEFIPGL